MVGTLSTVTLIVCVAAIGCFPNFFADLIRSTFSVDIFSVLGMTPVIPGVG